MESIIDIIDLSARNCCGSLFACSQLLFFIRKTIALFFSINEGVCIQFGYVVKSSLSLILIIYAVAYE